MPVSGGPSNGSYPSVSGLPIVSDEMVFVGAGTTATDAVHADGLPWYNAWFLQTAGAGAVSVTLQFANGEQGGGVPIWRALIPSYALAFNVPSLENRKLGSRLYRALVTATGAATVQFRLTASLA